jgi:Zn-dependent metalloprotease
VPGRSFLAVGWIAISLSASVAERNASAQGRPVALAVTRATADDMRAWDAQVDQLIRSRALRVRDTQLDALLPDRQHQRLDQYYRGVRIAGGDLTRQLANDGTVSLFGTIHAAVDVDVTPRLSAAEARLAINDAVAADR